MSQSSSHTAARAATPSQALAGGDGSDREQPPPTSLAAALPRRPMNPEQQVEALRKVQQQAEQRVRLGMQLFKAAEARLTAQQNMLEQVRNDQSQLREAIGQDVAKSLQQYDQWIGQIDESFTHAIRMLEQKVDRLQEQFTQAQQQIQTMISKAEAMLDQGSSLMKQITQQRINARLDRGIATQQDAVGQARVQPINPAPPAADVSPSPSKRAADDTTRPPAHPAIHKPKTPPVEQAAPASATQESAREADPASANLTGDPVYSRIIDKIRRDHEKLD